MLNFKFLQRLLATLLLVTASTLAAASQPPADTSSAAAAQDDATSAPLKPSAKEPLVDQLVTRLLENYHYSDKQLNDKLSKIILNGYLDSLDGSHSYFLASDIEEFRHKYATQLDDDLKDGKLDAAFEIYARYQKRMRTQIHFALRQLQTKPDFSKQEDFSYERSDAPWPADQAAMDSLWRKRVKNDAIGLMLAGKSWKEASDLLKKRYQNFLHRSKQIKPGDVFEAYMNAYAQALDPHTLYLSPHDSEEFNIRMSLTYEGIGAALQSEDEYIKIVRIIPGGSAAADGELKPNDRITAVAQGKDGKFVDVIGWRVDDVVDLIRGPKHSVVKLQILPGGAAPGAPEKTVTLVRKEIQLANQAAQSEVKTIKRDGHDFKVGVINVPAFYLDYRGKMNGDKDYRSTTRDVRKLIDNLKKKGIDGLVLDMRNNGGGSLEEATEMVGLFIDQGPVVQLRNSAGDIEVQKDPEAGKTWDGPLVVLVNRLSASATEIFAGAIQDYGRGVIAGSNTFGKGTVQNLYPLSRILKSQQDFGQVKLTIGKFYRVTGSSTQLRGVQPDIDLPSAVDKNDIGEETMPSALPWDQIGSAVKDMHLHPLDVLPQLRTMHEARVAHDKGFQLFKQQIAHYRELDSRKTVSLNLETRKQERDKEQAASKARDAAWRAAQGLPPKSGDSDTGKDGDKTADADTDGGSNGDNGDAPDVLLHEAAEIATDWATLKQAGEVDAHNMASSEN